MREILSALRPTMSMHMIKIENKTKAIEPIIQNIYLRSFVWKFTLFLLSKKYSRYFESCNALIFLIFYDLSASNE